MKRSKSESDLKFLFFKEVKKETRLTITKKKFVEFYKIEKVLNEKKKIIAPAKLDAIKPNNIDNNVVQDSNCKCC